MTNPRVSLMVDGDVNIRRLSHERTGDYVRVHQSAAEHDVECGRACERGEFHFRVTRPLAYPVNSPGHQDPAARQGHYTNGCCATNAACTIRKRLLTVLHLSELDVQVWP